MENYINVRVKNYHTISFFSDQVTQGAVNTFIRKLTDYLFFFYRNNRQVIFKTSE